MFRQLTHWLKEFSYAVKRIFRVMKDPERATYYPEEERKGKLGMWSDNLLWYAQHGEVNVHYFVYGLDRKKGVDKKELLAYKELSKNRNKCNQQIAGKRYNYVCMLQDKFVFGQFLASLGFPTPKNIAFFDKNNLTWLDSMKSEPLTALTDGAQNITGFCKKLSGMQGVGAFPLTIQNGKLSCKDAEITIEQLQQKLDGQYLYQERIVQHPDMARLHPASVNSIRLVTFNNGGNVEVFSTVLRIGARGKSVDNWASGGIIISIDQQTGRLASEGRFKAAYGGRVIVHPDSGVVFENYQIPFFQESISLACKLHSYFYGVHSIGWDIGITPNGPVFIEGNDDWDAAIPMALEENFKSRFYKMFRQTSQ